MVNVVVSDAREFMRILNVVLYLKKLRIQRLHIKKRIVFTLTALLCSIDTIINNNNHGNECMVNYYEYTIERTKLKKLVAPLHLSESNCATTATTFSGEFQIRVRIRRAARNKHKPALISATMESDEDTDAQNGEAQEMAICVVRYMLNQSQSKVPIKKTDIVTNCLRGKTKMFNSVYEMASNALRKVSGCSAHRRPNNNKPLCPFRISA